MTLLELLRQELPKRGGWPEGVTAMFQDWDGEVRFRGKSGSIWLTTISDNHRRDYQMEKPDYEHCVVTREQYEATGWDGTGLPPVGCVCEVSVDGGRSWCTYKAINEKNGARLIEIGNFTEEFQSNNWMFRPLHTEAERAIDEIVRLSGVSIGAAKILHDAGYRK